MPSQVAANPEALTLLPLRDTGGCESRRAGAADTQTGSAGPQPDLMSFDELIDALVAAVAAMPSAPLPSAPAVGSGGRSDVIGAATSSGQVVPAGEVEAVSTGTIAIEGGARSPSVVPVVSAASAGASLPPASRLRSFGSDTQELARSAAPATWPGHPATRQGTNASGSPTRRDLVSQEAASPRIVVQDGQAANRELVHGEAHTADAISDRRPQSSVSGRERGGEIEIAPNSATSAGGVPAGPPWVPQTAELRRPVELAVHADGVVDVTAVQHVSNVPPPIRTASRLQSDAAAEGRALPHSQHEKMVRAGPQLAGAETTGREMPPGERAVIEPPVEVQAADEGSSSFPESATRAPPAFSSDFENGRFQMRPFRGPVPLVEAPHPARAHSLPVDSRQAVPGMNRPEGDSATASAHSFAPHQTADGPEAAAQHQVETTLSTGALDSVTSLEVPAEAEHRSDNTATNAPDQFGTVSLAGPSNAYDGPHIEPAAVTAQVADAVLTWRDALHEQGPARFAGWLTPPELGNVWIELVQTPEGLAARLSASDERVQAVIETHEPALRQTLADAGITVSQLDVFGRASDDTSGQRRHEPFPQHEFVPSGRPVVPQAGRPAAIRSKTIDIRA